MENAYPVCEEHQEDHAAIWIAGKRVGVEARRLECLADLGLWKLLLPEYEQGRLSVII